MKHLFAIVLILVLVEDGLGDHEKNSIIFDFSTGLNPCFGGRWSRSHGRAVRVARRRKVLILVLVEDGLGVVQLQTL